MPRTGRPSEYKEEYVAKADEYLSLCVDSPYTLMKTDGLNSTTWENKLKVKLPTIEGFSLWLGVGKRSVYQWEKEHEDFRNALDKIRAEQLQRLIESGLSGDYNSTIAKLILSSNHGMSEKQEVDNTHKGTISFNIKRGDRNLKDV